LGLVLQYGSLGNIEARHLQLTVNPWRAQGWVLSNHAKDDFTQFLANALSSHTVPMM
jgi:hypothetical protein